MKKRTKMKKRSKKYRTYKRAKYHTNKRKKSRSRNYMKRKFQRGGMEGGGKKKGKGKKKTKEKRGMGIGDGMAKMVTAGLAFQTGFQDAAAVPMSGASHADAMMLTPEHQQELKARLAEHPGAPMADPNLYGVAHPGELPPPGDQSMVAFKGRPIGGHTPRAQLQTTSGLLAPDGDQSYAEYEAKKKDSKKAKFDVKDAADAAPDIAAYHQYEAELTEQYLQQEEDERLREAAAAEARRIEAERRRQQEAQEKSELDRREEAQRAELKHTTRAFAGVGAQGGSGGSGGSELRWV